jgi:putative hemolysin
MGDVLPQLGLIALLVLINAAFAGTELALVSLREGQLQRLERRGGSGAVLVRLARDPNRFLATIQIGITLAGFLASAAAAVTLAEPLEGSLGFLGGASRPASVVLVTLLLAYVTLVFGELAPKRLALQRAEGWGLVAARPLSAMSTLTRPVVWLLSHSTDLVVRFLGGDPSTHGEAVTQSEIRDLISSHASFTAEQRLIMEGAFEVAERRLREVLRPRVAVFVLDTRTPAAEALAQLVAAGHSRAPVAPGANLDNVVGVVHVRDLYSSPDLPVGSLLSEAPAFPESTTVLDALRHLQTHRQQLAIVVDEHGGGEGIVTVEDLVEELVGEIYDESDHDIAEVHRRSDGSLLVPGRFPVHDLVDVGVELPSGDYATVAGLVLDRLGRLPEGPGDVVEEHGWRLTVTATTRQAITEVLLEPLE